MSANSGEHVIDKISPKKNVSIYGGPEISLSVPEITVGRKSLENSPMKIHNTRIPIVNTLVSDGKYNDVIFACFTDSAFPSGILSSHVVTDS
jgi:hypothetical protein